MSCGESLESVFDEEYISILKFIFYSILTYTLLLLFLNINLSVDFIMFEDAEFNCDDENGNLKNESSIGWDIVRK